MALATSASAPRVLCWDAAARLDAQAPSLSRQRAGVAYAGERTQFTTVGQALAQ